MLNVEITRDQYLSRARSDGLALFSLLTGENRWPTGWNKTYPDTPVSEPDANELCVHLGKPSGVVVLDIDPRNGGSLSIAEQNFGSLPETFRVSTPSGGVHLYFRYPELNRYGLAELPTRHSVKPGLDLLADRASAEAPTSVRPETDKKCGGKYQVTDDSPYAEIPLRLLAQWIGGPVGEHLTNVADTADATEGTRDITATGRIMSSVGKAVRTGLGLEVIREDYERLVPYEIKDLDRKFESALAKARESTVEIQAPRNFEADVEEALYRAQVKEEVGRRLNAGKTNEINVLSLADIMNLPKQDWLIEGILKVGTTAVMYAEWGVGKSVVALDWCFCLETGQDWHKRAAKTGKTLYLAAEGAYGFPARIAAWRLRFGHVDRFSLVADPTNLLDPAVVESLSNITRKQGYDLVVFDTLNLVSGGEDENSATAMGKVMAAATAIRSANPGCVALILHHENKGGEIRGSSAIASNADTLIHLDQQGSGKFAMVVRKQKDGKTGRVGDFRISEEVVSDDIVSVVLVPEYSEPDTVDTAREVIERVLRDGPKESNRKLLDAARKTSNYSRADLSRAVADCVASGTVVESPPGQRGAISYSLAG